MAKSIRMGALRKGSLALTTALLFLLPPPAAAESTATHEADINCCGFTPNPLVVRTGDAVRWTNRDSFTHNVTHDVPPASPQFSSGALGAGATFTHTFAAAGVFPYTCTLHSGMDGTVEVRERTGLPDLVVTRIEDEDTLPGVGKEIAVTVANIGDGPAGPSAAAVHYSYEGANLLIGVLDVPVLEVGQEHRGVLTWETLGKVGDFTVTAVADATGEVAEEDEDNNATSVVVSVLVGGVEGTDLLAHLPGV